MNKIIKLLTVTGMLITILASCGSSSIVGHWERINDASSFSEMEFFSDGTYTSSHSNYNGSYSIDGDRLRLGGILVSDRTFTFELSGDNLKLYDDGELKYEFERVDD